MSEHHDLTIAKAAVKEVFAILGVDVDSPEKVEEFRKDLRFGGAMRRATDAGFLVMIRLVCGILFAAFCAGIAVMIRKV